MTEIERIHKALMELRVYRISFFSDGSGVVFEYSDPTGNHGLPCTVQTTVSMETGIKILSGTNINL